MPVAGALITRAWLTHFHPSSAKEREREFLVRFFFLAASPLSPLPLLLLLLLHLHCCALSRCRFRSRCGAFVNVTSRRGRLLTAFLRISFLFYFLLCPLLSLPLPSPHTRIKYRPCVFVCVQCLLPAAFFCIIRFRWPPPTTTTTRTAT